MSGELVALISLLEDDSKTVLEKVTARLETLGESAVTALKEAEHHDSAKVRGRAREVLVRIERRTVFRRLMVFAEAADPDLEEGLYFLATAHTPSLDRTRLLDSLDGMAEAIRDTVDDGPEGKPRLVRFLSAVHNILGFSGDAETYYNFDNNFLHTVIERRRGIPISLIAIYILLGRRLDIELRAIGTPSHALAWFGNQEYSTYIDAFNRGRLLAREHVVAFLRDKNILVENIDPMLKPLSDREILERMAHNLTAWCERKGRLEERDLFRRLARALFDYKNRDTRRREPAPPLE